MKKLILSLLLVPSLLFGGINNPPTSGSTVTTEVYLSGWNGAGSTNTTVYRFLNIITNSGSPDMTITQSASLGDSITINTTGIYSISFSDIMNDSATGVQETISITKNTIVVAGSGSTDANVIDKDVGLTVPGSALPVKLSASTHLISGDVIRVLNGAFNGGGAFTDQTTNLRITRLQ